MDYSGYVKITVEEYQDLLNKIDTLSYDYETERELREELDAECVKLNEALDKACKLLMFSCECPRDKYGVGLSNCINCDLKENECWKEWCMENVD